MADNGRSIVTRDLELEALRQQEEKMRLEIVRLKENIDKLVLKAGFPSPILSNLWLSLQQ